MSPTIISRLNNNVNVAVDTIAYLCEILDCQPGDIMEYIPPED
ncbi:MAG: helix-turn-helix transcriptional regulator [Anaerobutyricum sp.]|nr:helix-turn-helix transcriptional regulator [Anaerobutyricum sp.]